MGSSHSSTVDELRSYELKLRDGKVWAYYADLGFGPQRYDPKRQDNIKELISVQRQAYTSEGGGNQGTAWRGDEDFLESETYVFSVDSKLYSLGGGMIHSEFFSAAPVRAAGRIVSVDGKIQAVDNRSGHYMPSWQNLFQVVEFLFDAEVMADDAVIGLVWTGGTTMYFTVADFVILATTGFAYPVLLGIITAYQRQYNHRIPVPMNKLQYISPAARQHWGKIREDPWERFLRDVAPLRHLVPLRHLS
jgi:hypothetical protein